LFIRAQVSVVSIRCDIIFRCLFVSIKCQPKKCNSFAIHPRGGLQLSFFLSFFLFFPINVFIRHVPYKSSVKINEDLNMKKVSVFVEKTRKDLLKIYFVELRKTACKCSILGNLRVHVKLFFFSISSFYVLKMNRLSQRRRKLSVRNFNFKILNIFKCFFV
jgi:hypothetical protein